MTRGTLPEDDPPLRCPYCSQSILAIAVTAAGELIGCESCALERSLTCTVLSHDQWHARDAVREVLRAYALREPHASKPAQVEEEPRAHVWWVESQDRWYILKRYHPWLSRDAVTYEHSVLRELADHGLPVAVPLTAEGGDTSVRSGEALWGLYPFLPGRPAAARDWMWHAPKAAECLALLHNALAQCAPAGRAHPDWEAWTSTRLDALIGGWPYVAEVGGGLVGAVRDHLAHRYFGAGSAQLPAIIVHGEYTPMNVLWNGQQLVGIVDFEKAHADSALFDFAAGLGSRHPPLLRAVLATYTRVRPLSEAERQMLPEAMLLGALVALHAQLVLKGDYDEAARRTSDLEYLLRDIEVVRRAVALR
jgi:Ser/Thr protein kinase RdoA (MazF antagonist)